jgi:hypothetical protein
MSNHLPSTFRDLIPIVEETEEEAPNAERADGPHAGDGSWPTRAAARRPRSGARALRRPRKETLASRLPTMLFGRRSLCSVWPLQRLDFGRYRVCMKIGSGGMANVFLATARLHGGCDRLVAVKIVHPRFANDPEFAAMFLDESRIASMIAHPHVCTVLDFDVVDGTPMMVMEHLAGESLKTIRRVLRCSPHPDFERHADYVAKIIADACEGLHAAHELRDASGAPLQVVHRDVSPDNLFLTYDGVVKVVDFGVVSAAKQKHKTKTGLVKGKFAYVQPEALKGMRPDRRADVWSMGVVLWEMLTLRRLFNRPTHVAMLRAVLASPIPAPSTVRPGLPKELDEIVLRALARQPHDRYQTARELGRALNGFVAGRGRAVGFAELSEWMEELFPEGRAAHEQIAECARHAAHPPEQGAAKTLRARSTRAGWIRNACLVVATVLGLGAAAIAMRTPVAIPTPGAASASSAGTTSTPSVLGPAPPAAVSPAPNATIELQATGASGQSRTLVRIQAENGAFVVTP